MAGMRDWETVLTEYRYELRARRRAPGTIRNRDYTLRLFAKWCADQPDTPASTADVTRGHITRWIAERAALEAPDTVLTRFRILRALFRWAEAEEIIGRSPMTGLREPSAPLQPVPVLTSDQLRDLFATCRGHRDFRSRRDLAILAFLADTGVRVGELVGMTTEQLDFDGGTVMVLGKGERRRIVAFSPRVGKVLLAYLRVRSAHRLADDAHVWIGARGPLREGAIWSIVRDRGAEAGIDGLFPHRLRHTFAHTFRLKGGDEGDLAQLGGWRSPAMLARYGASAASERAVEAHRRVDPLGDVL
jgi:site-specific recombinase XerD